MRPRSCDCDVICFCCPFQIRHNKSTDFCLGMAQSSMTLEVPFHIAPTFVSSGQCEVTWCIQFEFVVTNDRIFNKVFNSEVNILIIKSCFAQSINFPQILHMVNCYLTLKFLYFLDQCQTEKSFFCILSEQEYFRQKKPPR